MPKVTRSNTPPRRTRRAGGGPPRQAPALWWLLAALAAALVVVVVVASVQQRQRERASRSAAALSGRPVPQDVARDLGSIPDTTWNRVGAGSGGALKTVAAPAAGGATPVVLYIGAEWCPYCAVLRWPLVATLERFGTLTGLELSTSSTTDVFPATPTFTLVHARYQSPYLRLETVELEGNTQNAAGRYPPLQQPTASQEALMRADDPSGDIPFLLIGGAYMAAGAPFSPGTLAGMSWQTIAAGLPGGTTAAAQAILAAANQFSAAICAVDGRRPARVCDSPGVRDAARTLTPPQK